METEFPGVFELDDERKLELIDALWDSIVRWTPKTGPGNKVVFLSSILGGSRCPVSVSHTV